MKYLQNSMWLVPLVCLIATGCTSVPLPKYARVNDYVTIPMGGTKTVANSNYLKTTDVAVTVTDSLGQTFPATIYNLYRVYGDPSSRYALASLNPDSQLKGIVYANEGQWMLQFIMPATNSSGQTPATGPAQIAVASTEVNPDPDPKKRLINNEPKQYHENLSNLPFEIIEGSGGPANSESYGSQYLTTSATILAQPDDESALHNNVGGAVYVFEYITDSFIAVDYKGDTFPDAGLPYAVKTSPDQEIQLATSRKDLGGNTTQLTAIVINPNGFYDDNSWLPGTSYYDGLYVAFSWDTAAYYGNNIVDDSNWQNHVSLVPAKSYYIDMDGNAIPNVTPVLSKVR